MFLLLPLEDENILIPSNRERGTGFSRGSYLQMHCIWNANLESFPNAASTQSYVLFISAAGPLGGDEEAETAQSSSAMKAQFNFFTWGKTDNFSSLAAGKLNPSELWARGDKKQWPNFDEAASEGSRGWDGRGWVWVRVFPSCLIPLSFPKCALNAGISHLLQPAAKPALEIHTGSHKQGTSLKTLKQLSHQAQENKSQLPKDCHEASH